MAFRARLKVLSDWGLCDKELKIGGSPVAGVVAGVCRPEGMRWPRRAASSSSSKQHPFILGFGRRAKWLMGWQVVGSDKGTWELSAGFCFKFCPTEGLVLE